MSSIPTSPTGIELISKAGLLAAGAHGLDFNDARPVVASIIHHHANLCGRDRRERELSPRFVIPADAPAGDADPGSAVPVLHSEVENALGVG